MEVKKGNQEKLGSCNYCNSGKLSAGGSTLIYPYSEVFELKGNYIASVICENCAEELKLRLDNGNHNLDMDGIINVNIPKDLALSLLGILELTKDNYSDTENGSISSNIKQVQTLIKNAIIK